MALRKPKPDEMAAPGLGRAGTALAEPPSVAPGQSADQCMATGHTLAAAGQLDAEQLALALQEANGDLLRFGQELLTKHAVGRNELAAAVATACGVPLADSSIDTLDEGVVDRFPEDVARRHKVMPVADEGGTIVLYAADPSPARRQMVEQATRATFIWKASDEKTVTSYIEQMYRSTADIGLLVSQFASEDEQRVAAEVLADVSLDDRAPVVQLVHRIVGQALRDRSSDIHIEPLDDRLRIRFRIDGHLVEAFSLPLSAHNALISRLKVMSEMNIVEKRRSAGRPVLDEGRRPGARRPRRVGVDGVRREDRDASARQVEVDGRPR